MKCRWNYCCSERSEWAEISIIRAADCSCIVERQYVVLTCKRTRCEALLHLPPCVDRCYLYSSEGKWTGATETQYANYSNYPPRGNDNNGTTDLILFVDPLCAVCWISYTDRFLPLLVTLLHDCKLWRHAFIFI